jgi:uncharacterized damage-inducible protein DinB
MHTAIKQFDAEYRRYKSLAEKALAQVLDGALSIPGPNGGNSLAVICRHIAGNLQSRFTDFLTSDGEKPWRERETEFQHRVVSRDDLTAEWEAGWATLFSTLDTLTDDDLSRTISIRRTAMTVREALLRNLAHTVYHVGQIVYVAHAIQGTEWKYLTIPPGGTAAYNANPTGERAVELDSPPGSSGDHTRTG